MKNKILILFIIISNISIFAQSKATAKFEGVMVYDGANFGIGQQYNVGVGFGKIKNFPMDVEWAVEAEFANLTIYDTDYKIPPYNAKKYALLVEAYQSFNRGASNSMSLGPTYVQKNNKGKLGMQLSYGYEGAIFSNYIKGLQTTMNSSIMIGGYSKFSASLSFGLKYNFDFKKEDK